SKHRGAVIGVETAARLASEKACCNHPAEQRRRSGARIQGDRIERLAKPHLRVEANEINELQWPHLVSEGRLDRLIYVCRRCNARLDGANGVIVERHKQSVENKPWPILRLHRRLTA